MKERGSSNTESKTVTPQQRDQRSSANRQTTGRKSKDERPQDDAKKKAHRQARRSGRGHAKKR